MRAEPKPLLLMADIIMEDGLYLYALRLVDRLKQDDADNRAKADAVLDLDTFANVPPHAPRSDVRYCKRRGAQVR